MIRLTFACVVAVLTACEPASRDTENEEALSAEAAIRDATDAWISAYERGDADTVANLFEEDAMYVANTGEVLRGHDGIPQGVRLWIAQRPAGVELREQTLRSTSIMVASETGAEGE
ncbi:MAG TPA: SgcJ/EcaC family oxidoreductase [Woeseiaceae bacterium]|jgi:uncharacterized protein (TIGR02246 family)|nr:SgcJ/EcaC family oxidoreductase [Woeseiaceae bacterium]